jgi:hypothetical protein
LATRFASSVSGAIAPVGQTLPHSLQDQSQNPTRKSISGVKTPSMPAFVHDGWMTFVGHTFMHCPQRVHSSRTDASPAAPGGRINRTSRSKRARPV